jgi:hypothetical protein
LDFFNRKNPTASVGNEPAIFGTLQTAVLLLAMLGKGTSLEGIGPYGLGNEPIT